MYHPLEGARAKIARANEHLEELRVEWHVFIADQPYGIRIEADPDPTCYLFYFEVRREIPMRMSVIAGDIVHNLRSALDHSIAALAYKHTGKHNRSSAFPVYTSEDQFLAAVKFPKNPRSLALSRASRTRDLSGH